MSTIRNYISRFLCLSLVLWATMGQAAPRKYPNTGTIELEKLYHVNKDKDKILRDLGYSEAMLPDSFPAFVKFWEAHGWPKAELLDLYLFECGWNDAVVATDTYIQFGIYIRPNFVLQSRAWIIAPDGWYRVRYGCMTALGRYSGKHAQVYSDRTGANPGCTPGTAIEIDHAGWSKRQPDRVCLNATAWGKDYGVIGGLAYTEGIIIENFRLVGNKSQAGNFTGLSTGVTLNEPGENSVIAFCMSTDFPGAGYTIFNGTPFVVETCSAFNNKGPGFDFLGSNGLCNVRGSTLSGDDNEGDLILIRPKDAQSVGGGTFTFTNIKSESRTVRQRPIRIEGKMGDLNLCIDGMTANFDGPPCDYLIGGNWTGTQFEINARGIDLRSNTQALAKSSTTTLTGGKPYSGNSFVWNDEGLAFKSRANMSLSGTVTPPGSWTCTTWSTCNGGQQTRTCTCSGTCADPKPAESQDCTVTPPPSGNTISTAGWTVTASATNPGGRELPAYAVDGKLETVWSSGQRQDAVDAWIQFDAKTEQTFKSATFNAGWVNDFARSPQVYVGASSTPIAGITATITGTSTMTITFPAPVKGRYFRLTAKKKTGASNWFTAGEATFFKP